MGHYLLRNAPKTGTGDLLISVQAVEPIRIVNIRDDDDLYFQNALVHVLNNDNSLVNDINRRIYSLYKLSMEEIQYIEANFT